VNATGALADARIHNRTRVALHEHQGTPPGYPIYQQWVIYLVDGFFSAASEIVQSDEFLFQSVVS